MRNPSGIADRYEALVREACDRVRGRLLRARADRLAEAVAALAEVDLEETRAWIERADPDAVVTALELESRFDGASAWERLIAAGVLDARWASPEERAYVGETVERFTESQEEYEARVAHSAPSSALALWCARVPGGDVYEGDRRALCAAPPDVRGALAVASAARAVVTAEALGREHHARMRALGFAVGDPRPLWRTLRPYAELTDHERLALRARTRRSSAMGLWERTLPATKRRRGARDGLELALLQALAPPEPWLEGDLLRSWEDPQFAGALWSVRDSCAWTALAEYGAALEPHDELPEPLAGRALDAEANPFEPLVGLCAEGFLLEGLYDEGFVLVARSV